MAKMHLDIVTPDRQLVSEDVTMVIVRAIDGEAGILPGHAPLILALGISPLRYFKEDNEFLVSICGGVIQVENDQVTVLATCAECCDDIDVKRAEAAKERAEDRLKNLNGEIDARRAELALQRALTRLQVAQQSRR